MNAREQPGQQLARHVVQHVERADGIERALVELDLGQVGVHEGRRGDAFARAPKLLRRQVDPGQLEARRQGARLPRPVPAPELDDLRTVSEERVESLQPLEPGIIGDLRRPPLPGVGHRVVACRDERRARVGHAGSTSTSRSVQAASARSSAPRFVSPTAIT